MYEESTTSTRNSQRIDVIHKWLPIDHLTVVCSVTRPLTESEVGVDLALIQTSLLYIE